MRERKYQGISNLKLKNVENISNQSNKLKSLDLDTSQSTDEQENIIDKELLNSKDLSKENPYIKKENDNENLNKSNSKEKNVITVDLTNEEKIVFSQLGINPLIKLGKEYLTSNNFVLLKESNKETEKTLDNKKTRAKQINKISKSSEDKIQIEANINSKDKSTDKINGNNDVVFTDEKDEITIKDELNNSRKKRRRSSASIE